LGRGGVDAAQPLGQGEGAFGLGAVGQEAAGLSACPAAGQAKAPLVAVGDSSTSVRRWLTAWPDPLIRSFEDEGCVAVLPLKPLNPPPMTKSLSRLPASVQFIVPLALDALDLT
jgi:hypothetical protein